MNMPIDLSDTKLGKTGEEGIADFLKDLLGIHGLGLNALILYGSAATDQYRPGKSDINLLAVVNTIDVLMLRNLLDPLMKSRKYNIAPLFLTADDLRSTAELFPLKYLAMKDHYKILFGDNVLQTMEVTRENVILRIAQRLTNMLLKMRRYYLVNNGQHLAAIMSQQIKRFVETLGFALRVRNICVIEPHEVIRASAKAFGLSADTLKELYGFAYEETTLPGEDEEKLFGRFLEAVEKISKVVAGTDTYTEG